MPMFVQGYQIEIEGLETDENVKMNLSIKTTGNSASHTIVARKGDICVVRLLDDHSRKSNRLLYGLVRVTPSKSKPAVQNSIATKPMPIDSE